VLTDAGEIGARGSTVAHASAQAHAMIYGRFTASGDGCAFLDNLRCWESFLRVIRFAADEKAQSATGVPVTEDGFTREEVRVWIKWGNDG